jgi:hypothetical protein
MRSMGEGHALVILTFWRGDILNMPPVCDGAAHRIGEELPPYPPPAATVPRLLRNAYRSPVMGRNAYRLVPMTYVWGGRQAR